MSKDAAYVGHLVAKLRLKDRLCSICMEIHDQGHCRTYAKGEPTRRKLKVAFPDLETSNAQSRCKFATCLGSPISCERLDILDTEPVPQHLFQFCNKAGQSDQIPCTYPSRPAAEAAEADPPAQVNVGPVPERAFSQIQTKGQPRNRYHVTVIPGRCSYRSPGETQRPQRKGRAPGKSL